MPTYTIDEYNELLRQRRERDLENIPPDRSHVKVLFFFIGIVGLAIGIPMVGILMIKAGYPDWQAWAAVFGIIAIFGAIMRWEDKFSSSRYVSDDDIPWDSDEPWDGGMGGVSQEYIETVDGEVVDDTRYPSLAPRNGLLRLMAPKKQVSKNFDDLDFNAGALWTPDFIELLDCPTCGRLRWHGSTKVSKGKFSYTCRKCGNVQ